MVICKGRMSQLLIEETEMLWKKMYMFNSSLLNTDYGPGTVQTLDFQGKQQQRNHSTELIH